MVFFFWFSIGAHSLPGLGEVWVRIKKGRVLSEKQEGVSERTSDHSRYMPMVALGATPVNP